MKKNEKVPPATGQKQPTKKAEVTSEAVPSWLVKLRQKLDAPPSPFTQVSVTQLPTASLPAVEEKRPRLISVPTPASKRPIQGPIQAEKKTPPVPDSQIETYEYPIVINVIGEMLIFTPDLKHQVTLRTGRYMARKVPLADGIFLMMRFPVETGKVEYGLHINQWAQYCRRDAMSVTVTIEGLD